MATWHQERNRAGMNALYRAHPSEYKVVSDEVDKMAWAMLFAERAAAEAYREKVGGILIPPDNVTIDGGNNG